MDRRNEYRIMVGKSEGKKPLGRHARRSDNKIKMDLREREWGALTGFICLRIGTSGGSCEHGNKTLGSLKIWEVLE
jgi:hypothetical protein